jgi:predicted RNA-binding protein YlxR (DUF448 family)
MDRIGPGRGAWLCQESGACFEAAARRHAFDKAFGTRVTESAVEQLRAHLGGASKQQAPDVRG